MFEKIWQRGALHYRLRIFSLRNDGRGVSCDARGIYIASTCPLVWARRAGAREKTFVVRPADQVRLLLKFVYGELFDADSRLAPLHRAADALNRGDLTRAIIATLEMRLPDLPAEATSDRLAKAHHILKHNIDPDQPRDPRGRWVRRAARLPAPYSLYESAPVYLAA